MTLHPAPDLTVCSCRRFVLAFPPSSTRPNILLRSICREVVEVAVTLASRSVKEWMAQSEIVRAHKAGFGFMNLTRLVSSVFTSTGQRKAYKRLVRVQRSSTAVMCSSRKSENVRRYKPSAPHFQRCRCDLTAQLRNTLSSPSTHSHAAGTS